MALGKVETSRDAAGAVFVPSPDCCGERPLGGGRRVALTRFGGRRVPDAPQPIQSCGDRPAPYPLHPHKARLSLRCVVANKKNDQKRDV